jgi:hypothetical protein
LFLAFIQGLKDGNEEIKIKISHDDVYLKMKLYPENFWSSVGYIDPNSTMDVDKIENYVENFDDEETE